MQGEKSSVTALSYMVLQLNFSLVLFSINSGSKTQHWIWGSACREPGLLRTHRPKPEPGAQTGSLSESPSDHSAALDLSSFNIFYTSSSLSLFSLVFEKTLASADSAVIFAQSLHKGINYSGPQYLRCKNT